MKDWAIKSAVIVVGAALEFWCGFLVGHKTRPQPPVFTPRAVENEEPSAVYVGTFEHPQQGGGTVLCAHYEDVRTAAKYREELLKHCPEVKVPGEVLYHRSASYDGQTILVLRRLVEHEKELPPDLRWICERAQGILDSNALQPLASPRHWKPGVNE